MDVEFKCEKAIIGSQSKIANGSISWCSKTQDVAVLSIQENEPFPAAHSVHEGIAHNDM